MTRIGRQSASGARLRPGYRLKLVTIALNWADPAETGVSRSSAASVAPIAASAQGHGPTWRRLLLPG
jgi:hypothetical protein